MKEQRSFGTGTAIPTYIPDANSFFSFAPPPTLSHHPAHLKTRAQGWGLPFLNYYTNINLGLNQLFLSVACDLSGGGRFQRIHAHCRLERKGEALVRNIQVMMDNCGPEREVQLLHFDSGRR